MMMDRLSRIVIPLAAAEMLYVALATAMQSSVFDERTKQNLGLILDAYRARRDDYLKRAGVSMQESSRVTEAAAEALANWLDDRALKADLEDREFDAFEDDYNSSAPQGGRAWEEADNEVWRPHPEAPPGGGWDPDGGGTDPGFQGPT